MKYHFPYTLYNDPQATKTGTWLVVLHASHIPPHIGLMINGNYNSLTIKERELNVKWDALLKTVLQKKIETLFVKICKHPVFSEEFMLLNFQEILQQFNSVKQNEATCLTPVKLFFEEFYAIKNDSKQLFFDFLETLRENDYLSDMIGMNIKSVYDNNVFKLKTYTKEQLENRITEERANYLI